MDLRTLGESYALGLELHILDPEVVVQWVDWLILEMDSPPYPLVVASLSSKSPDTLVDALRTLPGPIDNMQAYTLLFGHMRTALHRDQSKGPRIARALFDMAMTGQTPSDEALSQMYRLDDAFSLAIDGIHGVLSGVLLELDTFLEEYGEATSGFVI